MWRTLGISEHDWQQTPPAVQIKLRSQYHEAHSLKLRSVSYRGQIASLAVPAVRIQQLNRRIASQQKQIVQLQQHITDTLCAVYFAKSSIVRNGRNKRGAERSADELLAFSDI